MGSSTVQNVAKQEEDNRAHPTEWTWVEASIWTPRMLTALGNGVKGGKWFSLMDKIYAERTLEAAWKQVKANKGAAGVDRISVERFERKASEYLRELHESLKDGSYHPDAIRRVYIPKADGTTRPLGIPTVKDRIVQTAVKMALEPIYEKEFLSCSYGFRPGMGCKDALRQVDGAVRAGYTWVVDADLKGYFDSIPHDQLLNRLAEQISDGRVLGMVKQFLTQNVSEEGTLYQSTRGSPQGGVISPLLANAYLHPLDVLMMQQGFQYVRYADDFVILCKSEREANEALDHVRQWTVSQGLTLHPDKTHVGDCSQSGHGFAFLGYLFEAGRRWVRAKSMKALRDTIREKTKRKSGNINGVISNLNLSLKGWFEYFKHAYHTTFPPIDGFVRRRLRSILRRHIKKTGGTGRAYSDHQMWPNAFFTQLGLFTMTEAWRRVSRSRRGNH